MRGRPVVPAPFPLPAAAPALVRYGAYPLVAAIAFVPALMAVGRGWDRDLAFLGISLFVYAACPLVEASWPYRAEWRMDGRGFRRDLQFGGLSLLTGWVVNLVAASVTMRLTLPHPGWLSRAPLALALPAGLVVYELSNYVHHRWSHGGRGRVGGFLWRVHAVHHIPERMNGLMTLTGHPLNVLVQRITTVAIPLWTLGLDLDAIFLLNVVVMVVGTLSHWNVDSRLGPVNHLLVGPEVHRWHHDARPGSSANFGTVLSLWDRLFGTFRYRRDEAPPGVGVWNPDGYPESDDVPALLSLAFRPPRVPPPG